MTAQLTHQIRVIVVDDHTLVAQSIVQVLALEPDIAVVAVAATATEALDQVRHHRPDVVLLDCVLPDGAGPDLIGPLRALAPDAQVVMMTGHVESQAVLTSVQAGCLGFVTKDRAVAELVGAVRAASRGEPALAPAVLRRLLDGQRVASSVVALTEREMTVLKGLAGGVGIEGIAADLFLSTKTVRNHVQNVLAKLDAHTQLEAVVKAVQAGLVQIPAA